jgi:competence protein ComEC
MIPTYRLPLIYASVIFAFGIIWAKYAMNYPGLLLPMVVTVLLFSLAVLVFGRQPAGRILAVFLLLSAGALRFYLTQNTLSHHNISLSPADSIRAVVGTVVETHRYADGRMRCILECDSAIISRERVPVAGSVQIMIPAPGLPVCYGDKLLVPGSFHLPPGQRNPGLFNYRAYLAENDIFLTLYINDVTAVHRISTGNGNFLLRELIVPFRDYVSRQFAQYTRPPVAAMLHALLLGEKQDLEKSVVREFRDTGVVHVLAISGLHVGFIIVFVFALLGLLRVPYRWRVIVLALVLLFFIALVNFKAPVIRASLMALLYLLAKLRERKVPVYNVLAAAAFILLLADPRSLFQPGFQFSFMAVFAIIYGYEKLAGLPYIRDHAGLSARDMPVPVRLFRAYLFFPLLVSVAATIGTLPLTMFYYGKATISAVIANIFIIPLIGVFVLFALFFLLLGSLHSILAVLLGDSLNLLHAILTQAVHWLSALDIINPIVATPSVWGLILIYSVLFGLTNLQYPPARYLLMVAIVFIAAISAVPEKRDPAVIHAEFIDVGQGDAALFEFPNGNTMLVDAGDANLSFDSGEQIIVPLLQSRGILHLNYAVISHAHSDHCGGMLHVLKNISVDTLVTSIYPYPSAGYNAIIEYCDDTGIPVRYVETGHRLHPDPAARVYVLHPGGAYLSGGSFNGAECNNSSVVLKIQYGENGVLLTGDCEHDVEQVLVGFGDLLESEIFKAGHHGSSTSNTGQFLQLVQPVVSVISVGEHNKFRHPSPKVVQRFRDFSTATYQTATAGAVQFQIGPEEIRLSGW